MAKSKRKAIIRSAEGESNKTGKVMIVFGLFTPHPFRPMFRSIRSLQEAGVSANLPFPAPA